MLVGALGAIFGGVVGSWYTSRKLKKKHDKEKRDLLQYLQLQDEVYTQRDKQWQKEYTKLYNAHEKLQSETLERDYEEFKAPDTNNDDMISRAEVSININSDFNLSNF